MRFIQHKAEAYWFYRVVSLGYDRYINPLFWTEAMRDEALALAALDRPDLDVADVGAGTGFTTAGIVARVAPEHVTMIDQSPHQLARAKAKPALAAVRKEIGDAEAIPLPTDAVDRYVSGREHRVLARPAARDRRGLPRRAARRRRADRRPAAAHAPDRAAAVGRVDAVPVGRRVRDVDAARRVHRPAPRRGRAAVVAARTGTTTASRSPA